MHEKLNYRRLEMIERKSKGLLTPDEEIEFNHLQTEFFKHIDNSFPQPLILSDERLKQLEDKYGQ